MNVHQDIPVELWRDYDPELIASLEDSLYDAIAQGLKPDPLLLVSEWAEKHRVLSPTASAEPGAFRNARTPYLREIQDCLSFVPPHDRIWRVVFMKGAQVGGTEGGNNWLGYIIAHAPAPSLVVQPTVEMGKRWSKQRLAPLIADSDQLSALVKEARTRDSGNTVQMKEFPGGLIVITGANSAVGLRSMPVRNVFLDEVDAYPGDVDGEGDPVELAIARTNTFLRRKVLEVSTPTVAGLSRIERDYDESDQRRYYVPCPHCDKKHIYEMEHIEWKRGQPETAVYVCPNCALEIAQHRKMWQLSRGTWVPTNENGAPGVAGFHLSGLYSPWMTWVDIATRKEKVKDDDSLNKVFVNTIEGRCWVEKTEAPKAAQLYERAKGEQGDVPENVLFLTAGADVQADRIECEVVGWDRYKRSHSVEYHVFEGDVGSPAVWSAFWELLEKTWVHPSGVELQIRKLAVDSGYATQTVYEQARSKDRSRVMCVKGVETSVQMAAVGVPNPVDVGVRGKKRKAGVTVYPVSTHILKSELYRWLNLQPVQNGDEVVYPPGYCSFASYDMEYFEQLTAEQLVTRWKGNVAKRSWEKRRKRNEALDCRVYARAAASLLGLDRWGERRWDALEKSVTAKVSAPLEIPVIEAPSSLEGERAVAKTEDADIATKRPLVRRRRFVRSKFLGG